MYAPWSDTVPALQLGGPSEAGAAAAGAPQTAANDKSTAAARTIPLKRALKEKKSDFNNFISMRQYDIIR